jgi:acetyltransferase-like isoleucine patch superfamily enzyme
MKILFFLSVNVRILTSFARITLLRLFGLKAGKGILLAGRFHWPMRRLSNLKLGNRVNMRGGVFLTNTDEGLITIGDDTAISGHITILGDAPVTIGNDCVFAFNISLITVNHKLGWMVNPAPMSTPRPISIGNRCFIGCNVTILSGVELGNNCVVGAGSIVTHSFPDGSVIAGNPAKLIRNLKP